MGDSSCAICKRARPQELLNRICELDICDDCELGDLRSRVDERGWTLRGRDIWKRLLNEKTFRVEVVASLGMPIWLGFTCAPETIGSRIGKLFFKDLEVGDPLFDMAVKVWTKKRDAAGLFFSRSSVQSAVLELMRIRCNDARPFLSTLEGELRFTSGTLAIENLQKAEVLCCVLLHNLEDFALEDRSTKDAPYR